MKKIKVFLFLTFIFSLCNIIQKASIAQTFRNAIEYMDIVGVQFTNINNETWDYTSAVAHGKNARKIETRRKDLVKAITDAIKKIKTMPDFEGDTGLRDSVLSFLKLDYNVINDDYGKIVDMEDIAEQSYDLMEALLLAKELANNQLDNASENMHLEQKRFAASHNINLIENNNETVKKLEKSSYIFAYYNKIYLIFFKSYKQEIYLFEAISKGDINGIEQNKNSLITFSTEGLNKLDTMKIYKSDASLKIACKAVLSFYNSEATSKMQYITDYFIAKEKFDKIKSVFDTKPQTSRTQADIDQFNNAVNEVNAANRKYQAINSELDTKRKTVIDNWNKAGNMFLDRHVPKNR